MSTCEMCTHAKKRENGMTVCRRYIVENGMVSEITRETPDVGCEEKDVFKPSRIDPEELRASNCFATRRRVYAYDDFKKVADGYRNKEYNSREAGKKLGMSAVTFLKRARSMNLIQ